MKARDEAGQALILALAFMLIIALGIGALVSYAGSNMLSTAQLRTQRSSVYAADGAVDAAIQIGRFDTSIGAFGATPCIHSSNFSNMAPDGTVATVTCTDTTDVLNPNRTVTFSAVVNGQTVLVAKVTYYDYDKSVAVIPPVRVDLLSWTYCGHGSGAC